MGFPKDFFQKKGMKKKDFRKIKKWAPGKKNLALKNSLPPQKLNGGVKKENFFNFFFHETESSFPPPPP